MTHNGHDHDVQGAPPRPRGRYPPPFMFPPHFMGRGRGRFPGGYYFYYIPSPPDFYMSQGRGRGRGRSPGGRGLPDRDPSGLQVVVHNLPWSCSWQRLKEAFAEWNVQRADVIFDDYGRSRGFGTIRFATAEDANAAIEKMNNTDLDGRRITVHLDRYA